MDTKSKTYAVHTLGDNRCGDVVKWAGFDGQQKAANKARFIAAANPATVLALLDELEASQSENERLAKTLIERNGEPVEGLVKRVAELEEIATDYGMKLQRAQDALKHQSLLHKSQLEAAEKRIAELSGEFFALPPLNAELIAILGRPNFTCAHLAELLRKGGQDIGRKAECEQAAVIYWFLDLYLKYGDKWESIAKDDIQSRVAMITAGTAKGE
ncbi:TPA: ead/Ea22-like family protein [Enterobacter cloacae]